MSNVKTTPILLKRGYWIEEDVTGPDGKTVKKPVKKLKNTTIKVPMDEAARLIQADVAERADKLTEE